MEHVVARLEFMQALLILERVEANWACGDVRLTAECAAAALVKSDTLASRTSRSLLDTSFGRTLAASSGLSSVRKRVILHFSLFSLCLDGLCLFLEARRSQCCPSVLECCAMRVTSSSSE